MIFVEYAPKNGLSSMAHAGDLTRARETYLKGMNRNLNHLLKSRFSWMNDYIDTDDAGIEFGSGIGASKDYIKSSKFVTSDILTSEWIDLKKLDTLNTQLPKNSLDFIVVSNVIHHLAYPIQFFSEADRLLKTNGKLIIQEINTSLVMRIVLRLMKHEGYNEKIEVFSQSGPCNDPADPWSANCSIPKLLFSDLKMFEREFPNWKVIHFENSEFLKFINSGGVVAKTNYIKLTTFGLKIQDLIDDFLVRKFPRCFALQMQIVLEKKS